MATLRRSSAKLRSLGSGHGDLILTISQWKELRSATKSLMAAQESTANDLLKWSSKEENRAIKDVMERFSELCSLWTETVKFALEDLKEVRNHFEMILEGEKGVDAAKALVDTAEAKEVKLRKEEKKIKKRSNLDCDELRDVQIKIAKTQRDKDYAESEANSKIKEHELVKMIRVKEAMKKFCNSQAEICDKGKIVFSAGSELTEQIPELTAETLDDDILNMTYQGKPKTLQIVLRAKDAVQRKPEESSPSGLTNFSGQQSQSIPIPTSPPSYDEIHRQPPVNPYFTSSPDTPFNLSCSPSRVLHNTRSSPGYTYPE